MRWVQAEYVLKGLYLGLLTSVVLQEHAGPQTEWLAWSTLGGLALGLGLAAVGKLREGYTVQGRPAAFLLFLALESPGLVYAGVLLGAAVGVYVSLPPDQEWWILPATVGGGAVVGLAFSSLRYLRNRHMRSAVALLLVGLPLVGLLYWIHESESRVPDRMPAGVQVLIGMAFFYVLTFAGRAEESEAEVGVVCAGLVLGTGLIMPKMPAVGLFLPLFLYFAYTGWVLPGLRVFKLAVRGHSYALLDRHRPALAAFRRALELDPKNRMAREGLWAVHRRLDLSRLANDPETLALVDIDLCLQRASSLLIEGRPTAPRIAEAQKLLSFVLAQRPDLRPTVDYWRAVAHTHAGEFESAAGDLNLVLNSAEGNADEVRVQAWQLALLLHPEMQRRVGAPQLAVPGRRLAAIAAAERRLAVQPEDPVAWDLKRLLYTQLTEADYQAAAGDGTAVNFDHAYAEQLGVTLVADPARWQRGAEYLRMAVRGLPAHGPSAFVRIAQAYVAANDTEYANVYYRRAMQIGRAVGPAQLAGDDRRAYLLTVKYLADLAVVASDWDAAVESYQAILEADGGGLETLRTLAGLYEKKGDALAAARVVEQALIYDSGDKDLLERKDRYYISVMPEDLKARLEGYRKAFDVAYCIKKARTLLDLKNGESDLVDWALHLVELVSVVDPANVSAAVLRARALLRRGEQDRALVVLEDLRCSPPESYPTSDDQDSWYVANRLLGDLYLNELGRPDLAIDCFNEFRKSSRSGADTLYKLAQALEKNGDPTRAAKFYEQVTAYENHPLAPDARQALYRLRAG